MDNPLVNRSKRLGASLLALLAAAGFLYSAEQGQEKKEGTDTAKSEQQRAEAIKKLCRAVGIGLGKAVADIGCGDGVDTVTFAAVVGPTGKVYAEEIAPAALTNMIQKARALTLEQVVPILGQSTNPCLPPRALDLEYMHYVFHHFAHPGDMLHQLWLGLKPGGLLVIIDREKGPLKVWVEDETREKKHNWTGETTVVRLARESGFLFEEALEDAWFEKEPFVLVFRKPAKPMDAPLDPDPALPFQAEAVVRSWAFPEANKRSSLLLALTKAGFSCLPCRKGSDPGGPFTMSCSRNGPPAPTKSHPRHLASRPGYCAWLVASSRPRPTS